VGQVIDIPGEEIGAGFREVQKVRAHASLLRRQHAPMAAVVAGFGDHSERAGMVAWTGRRRAGAQVGNDGGIKTLDRQGSAITHGQLRDTVREAHVAVEVALDFADQRNLAIDAVKKIAQRRNSLAALLEGDFRNLQRLQPRQRSSCRCQTIKRRIVKDDRLAVLTKLHVAFDADFARYRGAGGGEGVLDDPHRRIMQAAMGNRGFDQPSGRVDAHSDDFEQGFDLGKSVQREMGDANCRAGVPPLVAQRRRHQIGSAVHRLG